LIADVHVGTLKPRIAAGIAPLMSLQLRAIETADLEQRLVRVEKLLATRAAKTDAGAALEEDLVGAGKM
jgi:hypothetical protein